MRDRVCAARRGLGIRPRVALQGCILLFGLQQTVTVPDTPSCQNCRVEFSLLLTLGDSSGPGAFSRRPMTVVRDSKGNYITLSSNVLPQSFDSAGRFVQTIGRMGPGPGEFGFTLRLVMGHGDSLYVFEPGRYTVLSPGGRLVREVPHGGISWVTQLVNQNLLVHSVNLSREVPRKRLHEIDASGNILRSFVHDTAALSFAAVNRDGTMWYGSYDKYELVRLDTAGRINLRLRRNPAWWPAQQPATSSGLDSVTPPRSSMATVHQDSAGMLWVVAHVPGPRWREGIPIPDARGMIDPYTMKFEVLQNSRVEVIDPATRSLVATADFPGYIVGFMGDSVVHSFIQDQAGIIRGQIWRMALRR